MLHEISFQIINMYSIGGQNWASELLWHYSKDLLEYIQFRFLSSCNINNTFDFATIYTTIPLSKLKDKLRKLVQLYFIKRNDQRRYKYLVVGRDRSYFVRMHSDSTKKFSESFWLTTYSYETDFMQGLLKKNEKKLVRSFNFTFRYTDDVPFTK
jgi:hypothetical protein